MDGTRILVTGGLGFVGSAVAVSALHAGHDVVILDNLLSGRLGVLGRIAEIAGRAPILVTGDIRDGDSLDAAFACGIDAVVHCAGLKSVADSARDPLSYYDVNVVGTLRLLAAMATHGVHRIVFSSSATVYGLPDSLPISEEGRTGTGITNPYGRTKHVSELLLQDAAHADSRLEVGILRYFNPIGAHESGLLGEDPAGEPTNIFPLIAQAAAGIRPVVTIAGADYPTPDGTGVRDFIHITDLAEGHLAAIKASRPGVSAFNLGTGRGTSVRELIDAYERASGRPITEEIGPRRPGDVPSCFADVSKARDVLGWTARRTVADACSDSLRWQQSL